MKNAFLLAALVCAINAQDCGTATDNMPVIHRGDGGRILTEETRIEYFYIEFELSSIVSTEIFKLELKKQLDRILRKLLEKPNGTVKIEDRGECGLPTEDLGKEFAGVALIVYIKHEEGKEGISVGVCSEDVVLITVNGENFDWKEKAELIKMIDHAIGRSHTHS